MKTIYVNGIAVGEVPSTGDIQADMKAMREFLESRGLLPEPNPLRAIRGQAIAFASAANAIYERDLKTTPAVNGLSAVPFVVNSAFSIELYLKTLHEANGTPQRGHHLLALYDALPETLRKRIEGAAEIQGPKYLPPDVFPGRFKFREFVSDLDNSFVEWRYAHEKGGAGMVKMYPTILVMAVLHEVSAETPGQQGTEACARL